MNKSENKFESVLFLPEVEGRKGEGGLRTNGYFKKSYNDKPLISIITVVYNGEKYLEETIQSVINQTYDNVEYIIIDGGSTDGTVDIINKYENQIDYWVSERDKGIYDAMNKGIDLAFGDYIFFLGADDRLENILHIIFKDINKRYLLVYGNIKYNTSLFVKSKFSFQTYLHNTIHHQSAFYSKDLFTNFRYDIRYKIAADYELNLLVYKNHKVETLYSDNIVSICEDDGISRINYKESHAEMQDIRHKYFNHFGNLFFDIGLALKLYLHTFLTRAPS
ncbi:MAG: glycosyltransferase family 2 protein [Sulfurimonas sp.]